MSNLYSIPVHESPECVKQMCGGILHFDKDAVIAVHVSKQTPIDFVSFDDERICINPGQFEMHWGWDLVRMHVSNYLMMKKVFNLDRIMFLTSNCLLLKDPTPFYDGYDAAFSIIDTPRVTPPLLTKDHEYWWVYRGCMSDEQFSQMVSDLGYVDIYGGMVEGCFVISEIMDTCCSVYEQYFQYDRKTFAMEEVFFATVACNTTKSVRESPLDLMSASVEWLQRDLEDDKILVNKGIPRDINNPARQFYNTLIGSNWLQL